MDVKTKIAYWLDIAFYDMVGLYGSYARGTPTKSSDIDIAVIVDTFSGDYLKASAHLFNLVRDIDKRIEPVLLSMNDDKSGFVAHVLKNGTIIYQSDKHKP